MYVENRQMACSRCGAGPFYGKEEQNSDRFTGDITVECVWTCARCGNRFAQGVVKVIKNENQKK